MVSTTCATSGACGAWSATAAKSAALRIPRIDFLEVLQNRAPFVRRETAQLVPRRLAELHRGLARRIGVVRVELVARLGRRRLALARVLALVLLQRPAGVEQPPKELLLARQRGRVEPSAVERLGELLRFL